MSIRTESWINYLEQTALNTKNGPHSWICEVREGLCGSCTFKVLTQDEYDNFYTSHSYFTDSCRKLSFYEIVQITENCATKTANTLFGTDQLDLNLDGKIRSDLSDRTFMCDTSSSKVHENLIETLNKLTPIIKQFEKAKLALPTMYKRGQKKHEDEKVASIWGWVKYQIWYWFYNQETKVLKIVNSLPDLKDTLETAVEDVKWRIVTDIQTYEAIVAKIPQLANDFVKTNDDQIDTPSKIKKNWFTKHHPDKRNYKLEGEYAGLAEITYLRVVELCKIWETLNKYELNQPQSSPSSLQGPLLLTN